VNRITTTLAACYSLAAAVMVHCATVSHDHHATGWTITFAALAALFGFAIAHHAYMRDELRTALVRLERASRDVPHPRITRGDWDELALACCLVGWETRGADHDPTSCTRKDHHA
jgi:hypothetical protein